MTDKTPFAAVLNGWVPFTTDLVPNTDDILFWGFRAADRTMKNIVFSGQSPVGWNWLSGSPVSAGEIDYVVPVAAFQPPAPDTQVFRNPLPVVVLLVMTNRGLIVIRRGLTDGYGKLAMPGGFHNLGETWQEAGCREVFEETGIRLDPHKVRVYDVITVQDGAVNLIFGIHDGVVANPVFTTDSEVLEVFEIDAPVETAFSAHTAIIERYFAEFGGREGPFRTSVSDDIGKAVG